MWSFKGLSLCLSLLSGDLSDVYTGSRTLQHCNSVIRFTLETLLSWVFMQLLGGTLFRLKTYPVEVSRQIRNCESSGINFITLMKIKPLSSSAATGWTGSGAGESRQPTKLRVTFIGTEMKTASGKSSLLRSRGLKTWLSALYRPRGAWGAQPSWWGDGI